MPNQWRKIKQAKPQKQNKTKIKKKGDDPWSTARSHIRCSFYVVNVVFYVTCNDILVIYVTAQMCRRAEEEVAPGWFSDNFNFCCIICLYFGISNFKIYPTYTSSSKYIFPDLNTNNAQFMLTTFLCKSEHKMSSLSHTCICLQKINWLSYLHTKRAKLLQKWQYKSHQKKEINPQA